VGHQIADAANRICDLQQIAHEIAHEIARVTSPYSRLHTYTISRIRIPVRFGANRMAT
jgi:hypothetical protein